MKMTVNPAIRVELVPHDHSLIIVTDEAVMIRCTRCGTIKDLMCFLASIPISYAPNGMRWCKCISKENAPNDGGDVTKVLSELYSAIRASKTVDEACGVLLRRAEIEQS